MTQAEWDLECQREPLSPDSPRAKRFAALFHKPYASYLQTMAAYNHYPRTYNCFKRNYDRWQRESLPVALRHWE